MEKQEEVELQLAYANIRERMLRLEKEITNEKLTHSEINKKQGELASIRFAEQQVKEALSKLKVIGGN